MKPTASLFERVQGAARAVADHLGGEGAEVAVVLGSGLASVADRLTDPRSAPYASLPGFPETTVAGHPGRMIVGTLGDRKVLLLCGRVHGYEGYPASEVGFGVRVAASLGARTLIVTNAAGGVDPALVPGEIVMISDQINLTGQSPLTGPNDERLGPRFPDMTDAYAPELRTLAGAVARHQGLSLHEGVYCAMQGPSYETPAEIRMARAMGADLVGMSTVPEVIVARAIGLRVLGVSCITNLACGLSNTPITHAEVLETTAAAAGRFKGLIRGVVEAL